MRWNTRADWNARPPRHVRTDISPVGVAVHWYGGGSFKRANHKDCLALVKAAQNQHMSDPGVNDIMYNLAACHHGYLIEARSTQARPKVRSGANGTAAANAKWYAILALWGRADGEPSPELLAALRDGIDWLRREAGAGDKLSGHRDHVSTECPGSEIYMWVRRGAPRPRAREDDDMPTVEQIWKTPVVPSRDHPTQPARGNSTPAGVLSNIEATQDQHSVQLKELARRLDEIAAKLDALARK